MIGLVSCGIISSKGFSLQILSSKNLCRLLSVLLFIGSQPVGYRHAHAGGDEHHHHDHHEGCNLCQHLNHDEDRHDEDRHDEDCDAHAESDCEVDHEAQLVAGSTSHVHLTFFGFSLCIPGEDVPHDDDNSEIPSVESLLVACKPYVAHDASRVAARCDLPSQTLLALPACPELEQLAKRSPPVTSPPLCDVARHELTGVLLI